MPKTATNFKQRVRALSQELGVPYAEARNRLIAKATETVVEQLTGSPLGDTWLPPAVKPHQRITWDSNDIRVMSEDGEEVAQFPYQGERFDHDHDLDSHEDLMIAGVLAAALSQDALCLVCGGSGYDEDGEDELPDDGEPRCGYCAGTGYSVPRPLCEAAAGLFDGVDGNAGIAVHVVAEWLHQQVRKVQQEQREDGVLPYPFFVLPGGRVRRQDFWTGKPWNLIGFTSNSGRHTISASVSEFFEDPSMVLGWHPVLADKDGNWATYTGPVESVDRLADQD